MDPEAENQSDEVGSTFILILHLIRFQIEVNEQQLTSLNKHRARGPLGRRPPSFRHTRAHQHRTGDESNDDVNNNGDGDMGEEKTDVQNVTESSDKSKSFKVSLRNRFSKKCVIL